MLLSYYSYKWTQRSYRRKHKQNSNRAADLDPYSLTGAKPLTDKTIKRLISTYLTYHKYCINMHIQYTTIRRRKPPSGAYVLPTGPVHPSCRAPRCYTTCWRLLSIHKTTAGRGVCWVRLRVDACSFLSPNCTLYTQAPWDARPAVPWRTAAAVSSIGQRQIELP